MKFRMSHTCDAVIQFFHCGVKSYFRIDTKMKYVDTSPEEIIERWVQKRNLQSMLDLSCWIFEEFPTIPEEVEVLNLNNCSLTEIPKLPKFHSI